MTDDITIFITADEWSAITGWMYSSLERSEHSVHGHFLLECEGTERTWIATDGTQATVLRIDGPAPIGAGADGRCTVAVNSRFFRHATPREAALTVTQEDDGRRQHMDVEGVRISLPEHPGEFDDWQRQFDDVLGDPDRAHVDVDVQALRSACAAASVTPFGVDDVGHVHTWLFAEGGRLHLETPWIDHPYSKITIDLAHDAPDTVPALVDTQRLHRLLDPVEFDRVRLVLPDTPTAPLGIRSARYTGLLLPADRWAGERDHLEQLLCEFLRQDEVTPDDDGDYAVTTPESKSLWVRLNTNVEPPTVQVFSVLASDVALSPALLEELNSINATTTFAKLLWASDAVMAEVDLVSSSLDLEELRNALEVVRTAADRYQDVLSAFFSTGPDSDQ